MITQVVAFDEIDSTNAEARRRAEAGETGPLWLTAAMQTAGRGRRGRVWESPTGNLAATYLFTTRKPPAEAAQVSFVAALAAWELASEISRRHPGTPLPEGEGGAQRSWEGEGLHGRDEERAYLEQPNPSPSHAREGARAPPSPSGRGVPNVTLKWPNDLLINGRKAGGILVESGQRPVGLWLAVGMGINLIVAPEPAADAAIVPTSFAAEGVNPPSPSEALDTLDSALHHWLEVWNTDGFPAIADAWTTRAHGLGQPCAARLPAETVLGTAEGLDGDGALRLRLADGTVRRITAGDVFFGETV